MESRFYLTVLIILLGTSMLAETRIILPSLPSMEIYFSTNDDTMKLAIPLFFLGTILGAPLFGIFSDIYGKKKVLIFGVMIFLGGTLLCMNTMFLPLFFTGRFIQGLGSIVAPVVGWAFIQDLYPKDEAAKMLSWLGGMILIGPLLAPAAGGFIQGFFGWKGNFGVIFFLVFISIILFIFFEIKQAEPKYKIKLSFQNILSAYKRVLGDKDFLYYISFISILSTGEWAYYTLIPFYFEKQLDLSPHIFGIFISVNGLFSIFGNFFSSFIVRLVGVNKAITIGLSITLLGSLIFLTVIVLLMTSPESIVLSTGIFIFGKSFLWGPTLSRALQRFDDIRGSASAIRLLIIMTAMALGAFTGKFIDSSSLLPLGMFLLFAASLCWIIRLKVRLR